MNLELLVTDVMLLASTPGLRLEPPKMDEFRPQLPERVTPPTPPSLERLISSFLRVLRERRSGETSSSQSARSAGSSGECLVDDDVSSL